MMARMACLACLVVAGSSAAHAARPFPSTHEGIHIFPDSTNTQPSTNPAQIEFIATHYAGTQKIVRGAADKLRAVNPEFVVLHYRLGQGLGYRKVDSIADCKPSGKYVRIIDGNWTQEWPGNAVVQDDWFYLNASRRTLMCKFSWYLMDIRTRKWANWWIPVLLQQLRDNDNDAVFADSMSPPSFLGMKPQPPLPITNTTFSDEWSAALEGHIAHVGSALRAHGYKLIPNAGGYVTSRDTTKYDGADGVMIARRDSAEHFFRSNALYCTATARILIPAECSAVS